MSIFILILNFTDFLKCVIFWQTCTKAAVGSRTKKTINGATVIILMKRSAVVTPPTTAASQSK